MCKNNVGSVLLPQCEGSWVWTWQIKNQLLRFSQVMARTFKKWFHSNYCSNLFTANRITDHWFYQPNVTWATLSWCFKCYPATERRANTQNISFRNFLGQLIHICNSVDTIKLSFYNPIWHSTTDSKYSSNYCSNLFTANRITDHWFYQPNVTWATLSWCFKCYPATERRANTQNISFRNFLGQLIHICNSVDTIKLSFYNPIWHSTTDSFFSYMYFPPFILDTRPLLTLGCVWCVISSLFGYIAYTLPHVSHYTSPGR